MPVIFLVTLPRSQVIVVGDGFADTPLLLLDEEEDEVTAGFMVFISGAGATPVRMMRGTSP